MKEMNKQTKMCFALGAVLMVVLFCLWQVSPEDNPEWEYQDQQPPECACLTPVYTFDGSNAPAYEAAQFLQDINKFEKLKLACTNSKTICGFYNRLKLEVPNYRKYIAEGLPKARGKQIDFVLFYHQSMGAIAQNGFENPDAEESNRQTTLVMEQIKPDLVGVEGCYGKTCNKESEWEDSQRASKDMGLSFMTRELFEQSFEAFAKATWHLQFAKAYPQVPMVGIDDYGLHTLDGHMLTAQVINGYSGGGNEMNFLIWRIRSQIAVIRMATFLEERGKKHGAIVMGYAHGPDFKNLAVKLGIRSRFYVAMSDSVRDAMEPF